MHKPINQTSHNQLMLGALGIVYGDIGTSPLYALKSCFIISGLQADQPVVMGVLSLFIWALILIVTVKYIGLVLSMDHHGEGGVLSLATLVASRHKHRRLAMTLGVIATTLYFGDGVITPAISVISAVEGLNVLHDGLTSYVIPIAFLILTALFSIQHFGSERISYYFSPVMVIWFSMLFLLGAYQIYQEPSILQAVHPWYALSFLLNYSWIGLSVLGGVILVVTGAETLYADLGHFGCKPIQLSWLYIVFPSLVVNYLGQGALILRSPQALENPFYLMAPSFLLTPLIVLATCATIIASQSVLSGVFSLTYQSMQLSYLPRMKVVNTSEEIKGQIYIQKINWLLYFLTIMTIAIFRSSENMATSYGLSTASVMFITTFLISLIAHDSWKWNTLFLIFVFTPFFLLDGIFLLTNLLKFFEGAWFFLILSGFFYATIEIWRKGKKSLEYQKIVIHAPTRDFIANHLKTHPHRIPKTAIFLCRSSEKTPNILAVNLHHNIYLHQKIIFFSFVILEVPYSQKERFFYEDLGNNVFRVIASYGFKETPDMNHALHWLKIHGYIEIKEEYSIFFGRSVPVKTKAKTLTGLAENFYIQLDYLSQNIVDSYKIPYQHVIELGIRYGI